MILTLCTISTADFLAHTRCLVQSFLEHHAQGRAFVLLVDGRADAAGIADKRCTVVEARALGLPAWRAYAFRWEARRLCQVLIPYFLEYLFASANCDRLCYCHADTLVYSPLTELGQALDTARIVLVPQLLAPLPEDGFHPSEAEILAAGTYSEACIGLSGYDQLKEMLAWWKANALAERPLDHMAALFPSVHILRHTGYNLGYWNLGQRQVAAAAAGYTVNDAPLRFVHFSGFAVDKPDRVSVHQNRWRLGELGAAAALFTDYRARLLKADYQKLASRPYQYDVFDDGVPIPDIARAIYAEYDGDGVRWPDPFATSGSDCFRTWLNQSVEERPGPILVTHLAFELYRRRSDVQRAFPDLFGSDRERFARWLVQNGRIAFGLASCFIRPIEQSLIAWERASSGITFGKTRHEDIRRLGLLGESQVEARPGPLPFLPTRGLPVVWNGEQDEGQPPALPSVSRRSPMTVSQRGVNVIGYLRSESGVGEVARAMMRTLLHHGYPVAYTTLERHDGARQADASLRAWPKGHPFGINLLHVNADGVPAVVAELGSAFFAGRYNIGYWFWELSSFPAEWRDRFALFHEIWVASSHVQTTIAAVSPIPVVHVRPHLDTGPVARLPRSTWGLPDDRFVFLYIFDILNGCERKNPYGLLEAYRQAFGPSFRESVLVLKVNNLGRLPDERERLLREAQRVGAIILDRYLSRTDLYALIQACDAYVSLHRAEGFGLTMAEAMLLQKPVIGTAYSGNMDFMTPANSYLVKHRLVKIAQDYPPYRKGEVWAEPDLDHAASLMRYVCHHRAEAAVVGAQAAGDVKRMYSIEAAGADVLTRLNLITHVSKGQG